MKKVMLALAVVSIVGACTATSEAGWRYRRAVRASYFAPVVVAPRYVAPAPIVVARPILAPPILAPRVYVPRPYYSYFGAPAGVFVRGGGYYYGGSVQVHTPGLGLSISY